MSPLAARYLLAVLVVLAYASLCAALYVRERRREREGNAARNALLSADVSLPSIVVAFASQTGYAEQLAWQTAAALRAAGMQARLLSIGELNQQMLSGIERILFVVSTYGEGDPPDAASGFVSHVMSAAPDLSHLRFGMLALGDTNYVNFCGFGREVEAWLKQQGAQAMFDRIDVDNSDPAALHRWRGELERLGGAVDDAHWAEGPFEDWRLDRRVLLNPGSAGHPIYHLELSPSAGAMPGWEAGDLVEITVPPDPGRPREYSLASLPSDGALHLLVRKEVHPDGSAGAASGWLTEGAEIGGGVSLRLRPNRNFRLDANAERPLILIGNGTGLAGLRSLLKARVRMPAQLAKQRNWLIFGERNAAHDLLYGGELDAWVAGGVIERLDRVFSRDQPERIYVQDRLRAEAERLGAWVRDGAAVYVCGSLEGMAAGVDEVLVQVLGRDGVDKLRAEGRYRRDVY